MLGLVAPQRALYSWFATGGALLILSTAGCGDNSTSASNPTSAQSTAAATVKSSVPGSSSLASQVAGARARGFGAIAKCSLSSDTAAALAVPPRGEALPNRGTNCVWGRLKFGNFSKGRVRVEYVRFDGDPVERIKQHISLSGDAWSTFSDPCAFGAIAQQPGGYIMALCSTGKNAVLARAKTRDADAVKQLLAQMSKYSD